MLPTSKADFPFRACKKKWRVLQPGFLADSNPQVTAQLAFCPQLDRALWKKKNQAAQQKDATGWFSLDLPHTARILSSLPCLELLRRAVLTVPSVLSGSCSCK